MRIALRAASESRGRAKSTLGASHRSLTRSHTHFDLLRSALLPLGIHLPALGPEALGTSDVVAAV